MDAVIMDVKKTHFGSVLNIKRDGSNGKIKGIATFTAQNATATRSTLRVTLILVWLNATGATSPIEDEIV